MTVDANKGAHPRVEGLVSCHDVVTSDHLRITHLIVRRHAIRCHRRILQLRLSSRIRVNSNAIIVARLRARRSAIMIDRRIIQVRISDNVVITRHASWVISISADRYSISMAICVIQLRIGQLNRHLVDRLPFLPNGHRVNAYGPNVAVM